MKPYILLGLAVCFGASARASGQAEVIRAGRSGFNHGSGHGIGHDYVHRGWGHAPGFRSGFWYPYYGYDVAWGLSPWSAYPYTYGPGYYYDNAGPSDAAVGTVLGGVAGAIIGNNIGHHNGWAGAAIGAGTGFLLGAASDANRVQSAEVPPRQSSPAGYSSSAPAAAPAAPAPQNVTIINNYNSDSSMSSANSLYGR